MIDVTAPPPRRRRRPRLLLIGTATFWVFVGGNLVPVGLNAPATVLLFTAALFALPCTLTRRPASEAGNLERLNPLRAPLPLPLWGFAAWGAISAVQQQTETGTQNALVYLSFVLLTALAAAWTSAGAPLVLLRWIRAAAVVGAVGYLATVALRGPGSSGIYHARVYGEIVWIGMAASVPLANRSRWGYAIPLLLLAASLLSLSRTATAICALVFLALAVKDRCRRGLLKLGLLATGMTYGAFLLLTRYQPLRDRFTQNDNEEIGNMVIGTSGRSQLWSITWDSIKEAPWLGHGIGHAESLIGNTAGISRLMHPHNDYLRLWNDLGIIGIGLWVLAVLILFRGAYRRLRVATNDSDRAIHQAALFALIGLSLNAVTSNSLIYIFTVTPVAVIIGTSLGRANAQDACRSTGSGGDLAPARRVDNSSQRALVPICRRGRHALAGGPRPSYKGFSRA
ncbi:O-antigen ligase family protein [Streptomyces tailanensis]|uniref:O-antigen ligase family protein n=1 Tax=Streptomyces tailanensis TaxID=2569858 RepID=UPI00122E12AA|nr:O-antigen ligase family protein [Streptomyces tailanensis]